MNLSARTVQMPERRLYLDLVYQAARPFLEFVFHDETTARSFDAELFDKGVGEHGPTYGRLAKAADGEVLGAFATVCGANLPRVRLKTAVQLRRMNLPESVEAALRAGAQTLVKVEAQDLYLNRFVLTETARGQGNATHLLRLVENEATSLGLRRIVLEVSAKNRPALRFYQRHDFRMVRAVTVAHPSTERVYSAFHMAREAGP